MEELIKQLNLSPEKEQSLILFLSNNTDWSKKQREEFFILLKNIINV